MNKDNAVTWEEPPDDGMLRRRLTDAHPLVVALKSNPNRWARLGEHERQAAASTMKSRINEGCFGWSKPAGSFEAVIRRIDGQYVVYARYVAKGAAGQPVDGAR